MINIGYKSGKSDPPVAGKDKPQENPKGGIKMNSAPPETPLPCTAPAPDPSVADLPGSIPPATPTADPETVYPIKRSDIPVTPPDMVGSGLEFIKGPHGVAISAGPGKPGIHVWNEGDQVNISFAGVLVYYVVVGDVVAAKVVPLPPG